MAEVTLTQKWDYTLVIEPGEVPDQLRRYSKATVFRPDHARFVISVLPGGKVSVDNIAISGYRVLKNGSPGERTSERHMSVTDVPDWLGVIISAQLGALGLVRGRRP